MTDYRESFVEEAVELVIPPPVNVAQLMRFIHELEGKLHDKYASIMYIVGTWNQGVVITILVKPKGLPNLLDNLGNIPEVEKVEEEPVARDVPSSFTKEIGTRLKSSISTSKRICITLKENYTAPH